MCLNFLKRKYRNVLEKSVINGECNYKEAAPSPTGEEKGQQENGQDKASLDFALGTYKSQSYNLLQGINSKFSSVVTDVLK